MAKTAGSINEIVQDIKEKHMAALRSAVNKTTDKAVRDIYKFSISCIDQYYANYTPSIYDRTYQLYNTVSPLVEISDGGDTMSATVGVRFDASGLGTHYHSTRWGTVQGVENGYEADILSDFLDGIHPMTDGSPLPGTPALAVYDGVSTDSLLNKYLSLYVRTMAQHINSYLVLSL